MGSEQRKYPRVSTIFDLTYYLNQEGGDQYSATMIDMGKGGLSVCVKSMHQMHERLWFSGIGDAVSAIPTVVRWVQKNDDNYQLGVEFEAA